MSYVNFYNFENLLAFNRWSPQSTTTNVAESAPAVPLRKQVLWILGSPLRGATE